jgi:hypothetical protein
MRRMAVALIVCSMIALLAGCGGGGVDCSAACRKTQTCDPLMTAQDVADCVSRCQNTQHLFQDGLIAAMRSCLEKTCAEFESCMQLALAACAVPDGIPDEIAATCEHVVSCDSSVTQQSCIAQLTASLTSELSCYSAQGLARFGSCVANGTCDQLAGDTYLMDCLGD